MTTPTAAQAAVSSATSPAMSLPRRVVGSSFLGASALFRDGLAAIFGFGAVLGVNVYGLSQGDVLVFGVAASVVAAIGAVTGGFVDHRIGSKPVIVGSLLAITLVEITLMVSSAARSDESARSEDVYF